jgi:hypothetical protein
MSPYIGMALLMACVAILAPLYVATDRELRAVRSALVDAEEDAALYRAQRDDLLDSLQRLTGSTNTLLSALERPIIVPPAGGMVA